MSHVVRAALVQATWTGDTESMIAKHEAHAREAARQGAKIIGFQEGVQRPLTSARSRSPSTTAGPNPSRTGRPSAGCRTSPETGMVIVVPVFEIEQSGLLLQQRRRDRRRRLGPSASTASTTSPRSRGSGRSTTSSPGTPAGRSSTPPSARSASTSATTGTSPRGWRQLGCATEPSWSTTRPPPFPWPLGPPLAAGTARVRRRQRVLRGRDQPGRPGRSTATTTSTAPAYFVDPRGQFVGEVAGDKEEELLVRDLDFGLIEEVRQQWAFYRDRRPDAYDGLVEP
ncbi:Hydrolase OS=Streptomyces microflavus OX=1919 GN=Smic_68910 PE=4 SV=1 [Streptomyces microflavus]